MDALQAVSCRNSLGKGKR